jgi:long-chain acyl-CoA synthetase
MNSIEETTMWPSSTTAQNQPPTLLDVFRARVTAAPQSPALAYFDTVMSFRELDVASDELAVALADSGFCAGDRAALYMQNMPQYVMAMLAIWKIAGIAVPVNPMLRPGEVAKLFVDVAPRVLIALDELHTTPLAEALNTTAVERVITTSALDWQHAGDPRSLPTTRLAVEGTEDLRELITDHAGRRPPHHAPRSADVAVITCTSGTTGKPKGAMNTHGNVAIGGQAYSQWFGLDSSDSVLGVAPLFHVTGLTGHIAAAITAGAPLILFNRFHPDVVVDMIRRHRPTFTVGALTVFIALVESAATAEDLASLTKIASGGAPVAAGVLTRFQNRFGTYIHNVYGMTETTSPVLAVPMGADAPVEPQTSALSVGKPMLTAKVVVLDGDGAPVPAGKVGELAASGPQIVPGYWRQPEQTAAAFRDQWLLTGDVGYVDADGWFYLVDRKKDMIVASGFKVWPREVEDVLYTHEAVREAAVVGQPDSYRGETVKAFVSLRDGHTVASEELIAFCRERMAAYKYPRHVEIVDAIPKTATGKVMRAVLRDQSS